MKRIFTPEEVQTIDQDQYLIEELIALYKKGEVNEANLLESLREYANTPCVNILPLEALIRAAIDINQNKTMELNPDYVNTELHNIVIEWYQKRISTAHSLAFKSELECEFIDYQFMIGRIKEA